MKDKALRFLSAIVVALVMTMMTACEANETEKALDGKWESTGYVLQEDGVKGKMILNFDAEDFEGKMTINLNMLDMGEIAKVSMEFLWSADENSIDMLYDDPEIEFNPVINIVTSAMGISTSQIKEQLEYEISENIDDDFKIISLSREELVIEGKEFGRVTFKRKGGRNS